MDLLHEGAYCDRSGAAADARRRFADAACAKIRRDAPPLC